MIGPSEPGRAMAGLPEPETKVADRRGLKMREAKFASTTSHLGRILSCETEQRSRLRSLAELALLLYRLATLCLEVLLRINAVAP